MTTTLPSKFKVESGVQLLSRLIKKPSIEKFYPTLFQNGPKYGDIIEMFSTNNSNVLLTDIICECLLRTNTGGVQTSVLCFITDGNLNMNVVAEVMQNKIKSHLEAENRKGDNYEENVILNNCLNNINFMQLYDTTQLYISIHNLENILSERPNTSLIVFDTLTSFYWMEQQIFKITKMDSYIKSLLKIIQKVTKDHKVTILYTRPEYFSSTKHLLEMLEPCCENPTIERLNYRINVENTEDKTYKVQIRASDKTYLKVFNITNNQLIWL